MPADEPTILATSGGYRPNPRLGVEFGPLVHHGVELSGCAGRAPRVTYIGTAMGDDRRMNAMMADAARLAGFDFTALSLFPMPTVDDVEAHLLGQDLVWVHGGSVANLLAVWRVHGLDDILRRVWQAGVVLGGVSAGSICWFDGGTTDSFGPELRPVTNGLGFLPYGNGVHYDSEARRRPLVHALVADSVFEEVHCTDDGVGIVYRGTTWQDTLTEQPGKGAYVVTRGTDGAAQERRVEPRLLSSP